MPTLLHTHARATRRTSPSQPEDKGAVVARQQVFFWHPRTRRQPALLRSLSDCLPHPRVIRPVLLQKTRRERHVCEQKYGKGDRAEPTGSGTDPMTFCSTAGAGGGCCMLTWSRDVAESRAQKYASNWWTLVLEDK